MTLQHHSSGKSALDSVIKGQSHFCSVAETPVMFAGLKGENIFVIATIADSTKHLKIVGLRDRGTTGPESLSGKTVGALRGAAPEYFLDSYLTYNGIKKESIRFVDMKPEEMTGALGGGVIDAAVTWNPFLAAQRTAFGDNLIIFENERIYELQWNIIARQDFVNKNPEAAGKFLRALIKANDYMMNNPEDTQAITELHLGKEAVTLSDYNFTLKLEQSLLINMENQARWAVRNRLTDRKEVPSFLPLIYTEGLEAADPKAVTIIHE